MVYECKRRSVAEGVVGSGEVTSPISILMFALNAAPLSDEIGSLELNIQGTTQEQGGHNDHPASGYMAQPPSQSPTFDSSLTIS